MCRFLPLHSSLNLPHFPVASTSNRNCPPTWGTNATRLPWPLWRVPIAAALSYIVIPKPLTMKIRSPQSISHDWEGESCAPSTCKASLTTTSFFWRYPGSQKLSHTSPCLMALPATRPAKSRISCLFFLVNPMYWGNFLRSPQMWEVEAQSKYQLSFHRAGFRQVTVAPWISNVSAVTVASVIA